MLTAIDLFSGIGGFGLAGRWAGFSTLTFVEIDPFCRAVLAKNFPGVPIEEDILQFDARPFRGRVDLVCGGFPCQDISVAGRGAGLEGERSGLWFEMYRVICECQPRAVLIENVPALRNRGADRVLRDLEEAGYTAGASVVGADDIGASHRRKRVWIVGYASCDDGELLLQPGRPREADVDVAGAGAVMGNASCADGTGDRRQNDACLGNPFRSLLETRPSQQYRGTGFAVADPDGTERRAGNLPSRQRLEVGICDRELADADNAGLQGRCLPGCECGDGRAARTSSPTLPRFPPSRNDYRGWAAVAEVDSSLMPCVEREILPMADGISARLVRRRRRTRNTTLKALGNAVVPAVAYLFLSVIADALREEERRV